MSDDFHDDEINRLLNALVSGPAPTQTLERKGTIYLLLDAADYDYGALLGPQEMVKEDLVTGQKLHYFLYPTYICNTCGSKWSAHKYDISKISITNLDCGHSWCPHCPRPYLVCDNCQLTGCFRCLHYFQNDPRLQGLVLCEPCAIEMSNNLGPGW